MTVLEIIHSKTASQVDEVVSRLRSAGAIRDILTKKHQKTRLIKPLVNYDTAAMALSFVSADNPYTYHHLRRDVSERVGAAGVDVEARYAVPSAHVTIARFVARDLWYGNGNVEEFVHLVDAINRRLQAEFWPNDNDDDDDDKKKTSAGEWYIGVEGMLEFVKGTSWYGEGERV